MLVGIYTNSTKDKADVLSTQLISLLKQRGIDCEKTTKCFKQSFDIIVVVGGDGTVLDVVQCAAEKDIPILALNAGKVGFLSAFESDELSSCVDFIVSGKFEFDKRPLISCKINDSEYFALNEICVQRITNSDGADCTLTVKLNIGDEFVDKFRADGILIASPTGSTAYSLSAGGAVLTPSLSAFIATPLCAHTLRSKPIVFSDNDISYVEIEGDTSGGIFCDGKFKCTIQQNEKVTVSKSDLSVMFIKGKNGFYKTLFKKLASWS